LPKFGPAGFEPATTRWRSIRHLHHAASNSPLEEIAEAVNSGFNTEVTAPFTIQRHHTT